MKILVCGGRDYSDITTVYETLSALHAKKRITYVVTGAALGADSLAEAWAKEYKIHIARYPAKWHLHGRSAGPIRNKEMLTIEKPEMIVAFPGGKGTQDMLKRAEKAGISTLIVS